MKRLLALVLVLLLLTGCTPPPEETEPPTEPPTAPPTTEREDPLGPALSRENGALEQAAGGAVRAWPLEQNCDGVLILGETVLLYFSGEHTQLNSYTGEDLRLKHSVSRYPQIPKDGVTVSDSGLSYYDRETRTLVILDKNLREIRKLTMPDAILGIPVLDPELKTAYYSTGQEIRALDLETGIGHMLRQQSDRGAMLTGSLLNGTVLVAVTEGPEDSVRTSFIRAEDGLEIGSDDTLIAGSSGNSGYFLCRGTGGIPAYLWGKDEEPVQLFTPDQPAAPVFHLGNLGAVMTAWETETGTILDLYDLASGVRTAALTLPGISGVRSVAEDRQGRIWFLNDENVLICWVPKASPVEDAGCYTAAWNPNLDPDGEELARCWETAEALAEKYGIALRIMGEAIAAPWDRLPAENRAEVCNHMLAVVDQVLGIFPEDFLTRLSTISDNELLTLSLVGDAGKQGSQQIWLDGNAHLAVEPGESMDLELLRSIYRVVDTYVLGQNSMLDDWNAAKPAEARAELFVQAMMADNSRSFSGNTAQKELRTLCRAIRDAFGMKRYAQMLPWEQYLEEPLY